MGTILNFIREPAVTLSLMIILPTLGMIWCSFIAEHRLGGKRSASYKRHCTAVTALCTIAYVWLIQLSLWPFIAKHCWAFNLGLAIFIIAGVIASITMTAMGFFGLAALGVATTWTLFIVAIFIYYDNDGIRFIWTFIAIIALFCSEWTIAAITEETTN